MATLKPYIPRKAALSIREPSDDAILSVIRRVADETSVPSHSILGPSTSQRALYARRQAVRTLIHAFPGLSRITLERIFARKLDSILGPPEPIPSHWPLSPLRIYSDYLSKLNKTQRERLLARRKDAQSVKLRRLAIVALMQKCPGISVRHMAEVLELSYDTVKSIVYGKKESPKRTEMPSLLESLDTRRTMCKDPTESRGQAPILRNSSPTNSEHCK